MVRKKKIEEETLEEVPVVESEKETSKPADYVFIGSLGRLGTQSSKGKVTGKSYIITPTGTWVNDKDAEGLLEETKSIYCTRKQGVITVKRFALMRPDAKQMKLKPEE